MVRTGIRQLLSVLSIDSEHSIGRRCWLGEWQCSFAYVSIPHAVQPTTCCYVPDNESAPKGAGAYPEYQDTVGFRPARRVLLMNFGKMRFQLQLQIAQMILLLEQPFFI